MTIRLKYLLDKKDVKFKYFCEQNSISSYDHLTEYCKIRNIQCDVTCKEYEEVFPVVPAAAPEKSKVASKNEKKDTQTKKAVSTTTRRRGRKPKASKARSVNSKDNS